MEGMFFRVNGQQRWGEGFAGGCRKTHAQRQREYRARVKGDPGKYRERRASETLRVRMFRQRRSAEAVARDRELARLRMREYRWRKKQARGPATGGADAAIRPQEAWQDAWQEAGEASAQRRGERRQTQGPGDTDRAQSRC